MKRLLFVLLPLLFLQSCSSDGSGTSLSQEGTKVRKRITTLNGGTSVEKFHYDGSKMVKFTTTLGSTTKYVYEGNLVKKMITGGSEHVLAYDSQNRVIGKTVTGYDYEEVYTHNADNTIFVERLDNGQLVSTQMLYYEGGEIVRVENNDLENGIWKQSSYELEYDDKPNYRSEWQGFDKIAHTFALKTFQYGIHHNVVALVETTPNVAVPNSAWYEHIYNQAGHIISTQVVDQDGVYHGLSYTYFYEGQ
ncbi:hypothetical protein [Flavobacterium sp.]|uniref:hypothetical protein n=1 Tax=Flavobacterium sp. TaxID=239 RepID=UPI00121DE08D|nr:hypothetical protein [Flavobacterium sp.]RZJ73529.1 MAG: hypothetical protein EOO49_01570 [Flavobacterium sp.]